MRTFFQSTSSSSAMSIGSSTLIDCPTSGFLAMIVAMPSGAMRTKAPGASAERSAGAWASASVL